MLKGSQTVVTNKFEIETDITALHMKFYIL